MKWAQVAAMVVVIIQPALADDLPKDFKAALQRREAWLESLQQQRLSEWDRTASKASKEAIRELENVRKSMESLKADLKARGKSYNSRERAAAKKKILQLEKTIRDTEKSLPQKADTAAEAYKIGETAVFDRIAAMRADLTQWPPIDCNNPKTGDVGKLPEFPVNVPFEESNSLKWMAKHLQQGGSLGTDPRDFIRRRGISESAVRGEHNIKIVQILDGDQSLATLLDLSGNGGESFWLSGVDVSKSADGQTMKLDGLFVVSGTRQYETIKGAARTVHIIEPVSLDQLKAWTAASK